MLLWPRGSTGGCTNKGIPSKGKEVIIPVLVALVRTHLEYCAQFWSVLYKKKKKKWMGWRGPEKGHKDDPRTGKLSYKERLRDLGLFSCEKRRLRRELITMFQYLKDGYKEGNSLFTRKEVMGTNYSWGISTWTQ